MLPGRARQSSVRRRWAVRGGLRGRRICRLLRGRAPRQPGTRRAARLRSHLSSPSSVTPHIHAHQPVAFADGAADCFDEASPAGGRKRGTWGGHVGNRPSSAFRLTTGSNWPAPGSVSRNSIAAAEVSPSRTNASRVLVFQRSLSWHARLTAASFSSLSSWRSRARRLSVVY